MLGLQVFLRRVFIVEAGPIFRPYIEPLQGIQLRPIFGAEGGPAGWVQLKGWALFCFAFSFHIAKVAAIIVACCLRFVFVWYTLLKGSIGAAPGGLNNSPNKGQNKALKRLRLQGFRKARKSPNRRDSCPLWGYSVQVARRSSSFSRSSWAACASMVLSICEIVAACARIVAK